jgi:DNA-binding NtrC family response regulator
VFDNASDVLRQVHSGNPDVIITDIRMPGTDGLELLRYLNDRTPSLPVIVMTAHPDLKDALSAYRPVAFEYLAKPFDLDEAVGLVRRALEKQSKTRSLDAAPSVEHPSWEQQLENVVQRRLGQGKIGILDEIGPQFERVLLQTALSFTHGRKQEAARRLGWGRNTLTRKLKELQLD